MSDGGRHLVVLAVVLLVASTLPLVASGAGIFTDDDGNTHEANIEAIAAEGITRGCNPPTNNLYCPDDPVTRGQMAAFLVRAMGYTDDGGGDLFGDDDGSTFESDIDKLATAGVTRGCNPPANTEYCPDDFVTRGQMAAFLVRAMGYSDDGGGDLFTDDDGTTFEADIDKLGTAGVTLGCNPPANDRYCPDDLVRRDQMASFLARALELDPIEPPPPGDAEMTVVFVAVRQGDAAVYQGPCGEVGLIDTNRFRSAEVLAVLDSLGTRTLRWASVSHYDADHLGGILDVVESPGVTVGAFFDRGGDSNAATTQTYENYYNHVTTTGTRQPVDIGDSFSLCSGSQQVTFTVVSAGTDGTAAGGVPVGEENDRGLCLHVEYADFDLATCGDINGTDDGSRTDVESAVAASIGDVEVAKVNHHGSSYSSNPTYVSTLSAQAAVISVGKNSFGHPDPDVITRWDTYGTVFQTQSAADNTLIDGNIVVTTDGATHFQVAAIQSNRNLVGTLDEWQSP